MIKRIVITVVLISSFGADLLAQKTSWFLMNDAGGTINAVGVESDQLGNVFTFGYYMGESKFNSVDTSGPYTTAYASSHWKHQFIQKVNNQGELQFVCHLKSRGSNMNHVEIRKMKVLPTGSIAFFVYSKGGFEIQDASKTKQTFNSNQKSYLLILSNDGIVLKAKEIPIDKCTQMELRGSELLLLGYPNRYVSYAQHLWSIDLNGDQLIVISDNMEGVRAIKFHVNKLWLLHYIQLDKQRYYTSDGYQLSYFDHTNKPVNKSSDTIIFGMARSTSPTLLVRNNQLELMVSVQTSQKLICNKKEYPAYNLETGLFLFNSSGKLINHALLNIKNRKFEIDATSDNGLIISTVVFDSLIFNGEFVVKAPKHRDYIYESMHLKLDSKLNLEWYVKGGGISSTYVFSSFHVDKDFVTIIGSLYDYIDLEKGRKYVNWQGGNYIRRVTY